MPQPVDLQLALAAAIRELRGAMTQEELGLKLGVAQTWVSRVELGKVNLKWTNLCRVADGLGVPVAELAGLAEAMAKEKAGRPRGPTG